MSGVKSDYKKASDTQIGLLKQENSISENQSSNNKIRNMFADKFSTIKSNQLELLPEASKGMKEDKVRLAFG